MKQSYLSYLKVTLAAGERRDLNITGTRLAITEASFAFSIAFNRETEQIPADLGFQFVFAANEPFTHLSVFNTDTTQPLTVEIYYGTGDVIDRRLNVVSTRPNQFVQFMEPATVLAGSGLASIGATSDAEFDGTSTNPLYIRRKALIVSNGDAALVLTLQDGGGEVVAYVQPGTSFYLETSDAVIVANTNASAVAVAIAEIWYVRAS